MGIILGRSGKNNNPTDNTSQFPLMCPYQRLFAASDAEQRKIVRTQGMAGPVISTSGRVEERVSSHSSSVLGLGGFIF